MRKIRILYVESNVDGTVGGSLFSLLFLIEGLNKNIYEPIAAFYQDNYLIPRYERAGCKVLLIKKCKPLNILEVFPILKRASNYSLPNLLIIAPLKLGTVH